MKFCGFLWLSLLLALIASNANGQACGRFRIEIVVQTETGKPLETAVVQFLPITKDETRGRQFVRDETERSRFSIEFIEGQSVREFHRLIVSADGYKRAENEIKF